MNSLAGQKAQGEQELAERFQEHVRREEAVAQREQEVERRLARLATVEAATERKSARKSARIAAEAEQSPAAAESPLLRQQRQQAMADIEQQRETIQRRAEHVDRCWAALKQFRVELDRMHRETLEVRLATEELWAQLSGAAPPAALVRSLGQIRSKLAEQYRRANLELAEQRKELEAIRAELLAKHEELNAHKRQFDEWAAGTHDDCQQEASRLVAREQQLREKSMEFRHQSQRWQAERLRYQLELRRLQSLVARQEEAMPA
jgi:chromosome segregation ATPase